MKVIFIITFPPAYEYNNTAIKPDHFWYNAKNELIGVWRQDRGHAFAKDVKRFYPEIEFEVWRPDYRAEKEYRHIFEDGVVHRSFPAKKKRSLFGLKLKKICFSREMIQMLDKTAKNACTSKDTLIHLPVDYSPFGYAILKKYHNRLPFIHTSHLAPQALSVDLRTKHISKILHRKFIQRRKNNHKKLLGEIAVSKDRIEYFLKETKSKVHLINSLNQFDFDWAKNKISKEQARKKLSLPAKPFILLSSSRLLPEKQVDKMLKALASLQSHDFIYIISGNGTHDYEMYLKNLVNDLGLSEKVIFTGYLAEQLIDYYCAADAFIYSSWSEGGPGAGVKALALEVPVIGTNTGIVHYLLNDKKAGLILDKNKPETWASRIEEVLKGNRINIVNSKELEEEYGLEQFIRQLVTYYVNAIENYYSDK